MAGFLEEIAKAAERAMNALNSTTDDDADLDEMKKENQGVDELKDIAKGVGIAAGVGLLAWGTARLVLSSSASSSTSGQQPSPWPVKEEAEKDRKKMIHPGRDYKIYRDDFEADPKGHFSRARAQKKLEKKLTNFA